MKNFSSYILFFFPLLLCAQETGIPHFPFPDSTYRVGQIIYIGNELTKDYIIEHEMSLTPGSLITHQSVQYDIDRIYSLRLFTKVDIEVHPDTADIATLLVIVNERWYFYPYPVVGIKDRDFSKIFYGAGVIHTNFEGRNVLLFGQFAFGYDPFVSVGYTDPLFSFENKIFLSSRIYYTEQRNRSLVSLANAPNFDERRWGGELAVGKRYSKFTIVTTRLEYLHLSVTDNRAGRTLSPGGTDDFFMFSTSYRYDTRDLADYPSFGTLLQTSVSKIGIFDDVVDYQRYGIDYRRYIPTFGDLVIAGRVFTNIASGGPVPNYGHVFFGYTERIRGHFNKILEGEQIIGSTVELHYPLISPNYIRFDFIPMEQFRDIRYALYIAAFADAGNTWYRNEPLALNRFFSGYGIGLHLNLAYSAVARVEFAVPYRKPVSKGEIVLDIGAAL